MELFLELRAVFPEGFLDSCSASVSWTLPRKSAIRFDFRGYLPFPSNTIGIVRKQILKSSSSDQVSIY